MAQVESTAGMVDVERAARGEWLSWTRMSDFSESAPPVIVGGDGPYVIDQDGRRLLDCVSGLFTTQIGYSHGARIGAGVPETALIVEALMFVSGARFFCDLKETPSPTAPASGNGQ